MSSQSNGQGADAGDVHTTEYLENMRAFVEGFQIHTGREGQIRMAPLNPTAAIEPRVSDLMRVAGDPEATAELKAALERPLNRKKISVKVQRPWVAEAC
jgi:hypothetical protein